MIRGGGESAIRAAAQDEWNGMIFRAHIWDGVGRLNAGGTGMIIVKIPSEEFAVIGHGAFHFDDAGGTEIGPGEFFLAGPDDFDWPACGARKTRGFDGGVAAVLSTIRGTGVRNDHSDVAFGNVEDVGEFAADAEGTLRAGLHGQLLAGPFGDSGAGLKRGVRDVRDGVAGVEAMGGAR